MRLIDADWIKVAEELPPKIMDVLITILHPDGEKEVTAGWHDALDTASTQASTTSPDSLVKRGRWENGVCTACGFDLRCLTDGKNELKQWVWDEGLDYCPSCGALMGD